MPVFLSFKGRYTRGRYWLDTLSAAVVQMVLFVYLFESDSGTSGGYTALMVVLLVLTIWVQIAAGVKRLHDLGKRGWLYVFSFAPYVGLAFAVIYLGMFPSRTRVNQFDPFQGVGDLQDANLQVFGDIFWNEEEDGIPDNTAPAMAPRNRARPMAARSGGFGNRSVPQVGNPGFGKRGA